MDTLPIKKWIPSPQNDGDPPHKIMEDNKTINNTFNNTTNKGTRFTPPSVDEVSDYCNQRNNLVDAETFIDFYQAKGWMVGKNKMKDWKACVRTWETNRKQRSKPKQKGTIKDRSIEDALTDTSWAN